MQDKRWLTKYILMIHNSFLLLFGWIGRNKANNIQLTLVTSSEKNRLEIICRLFWKDQVLVNRWR